MSPPTGTPTLLSLAAAVSLLAPIAIGETREDLRQAIRRDLPRYDPAVREKALAEKAAREASSPRNAPAPIRDDQPAAPAPVSDGRSDAAAMELPKITIHPTYTPPRHLPRFETPPAPPGGDLKAEPFESAAGRQARLMKKHLTPFQRALSRIPLIGAGIIGSAYEAEARELKAAQMNSLAEGIEMQELLGRDPADIKKLRAEYEKLYYSGPKK